ncbi:MAG TPA: hypothetical protein V6C65_05990 [Allocoleopsis sp.]
MKTATETIDLKKAKLFLENNIEFESGTTGTNRPITQRVVNQYAASMLLGNWKLTHQGIAFDTEGKLKDGQHRLRALVQAAEVGANVGNVHIPPNPKIKLQFQVTYGLPPDIFPFLDNGLKRGPNTILALAGYTNTMRLAAAARLLYLYQNFEFKYWQGVKVSNEQVLETVNLTRIDEYISPANPLGSIGIIVSAAAVGIYLCEEAYPEGDMPTFLDKMESGVSMKSDDPVLVYRNYAIRSKNHTGTLRRDSFNHLALFIKTWNDYARGLRRNQIGWRPTTEAFPKPLTKEDIQG